MGDYDDLPYIVIERRTGAVGPFVWGALLGAGMALFLAPRSGRETQDELRRGVLRLRGNAEDRVYSARDGVADAVTRTRERVQDQIDAVRTGLEQRAQQAREAVDAGRRAAREARDELEHRVEAAKQDYAAGTPSPTRAPAPPAEADVVVTEVTVEEIEERPELG